MKKSLSIIGIVLLIFGFSTLKTEAADMKDLSPTNSFYDEMTYLLNEGIISGYPDGTFRPDQPVTRGEAAIMIGRTLKLNGTQKNTKFKDVQASSKASGYIDSAVKRGIISGYPNGTFKPGQPITRGDMSIILAKAFDLNIDSMFSFKDVGSTMASYDAIRKISAASISSGYPDGRYRPAQNTTRAQFSAFLARALQPEYKQKAALPNSYALNKTKQYAYETIDGMEIKRFKNVGIQFGQNLGYIWENVNVETDETYYFLEEESYAGLGSAYPLSEYEKDLVYPVKVGTRFQSGAEQKEITAINQTIKTPYKTFIDAVEVTSDRQLKTYYVKNIGFIKSIDKNGRTISELIAIE